MPDSASAGRVGLMPQDLRWGISAAAGPNPDAADAWRSLMSTMEFSEISPSLQRLAPQVFVNIRDDSNVPSRDRLKGAYRYTWTKNIRLWSMAHGFLSALTATGINYRLLKGAAMHAHRGKVGSRSIGDFDLLVGEQDVAAVMSVMESCGFRQEGSRQILCGHAMTDGAAINLNLGDCHVDIHVAPWKEPRALLSQMLTEEAISRQVGSTMVLIPSTELLLLHASWHATRQTSPTDLAQGLVDVALLAREVSLNDVRSAALATASADAVGEAGLLLLEAGLDTGLPSISRPRRSNRERRKAQPVVKAVLERHRLARMLHDRHVTGLRWAEGSSDVNLGGLGYQAWLRMGRPGKLEGAMSLARGFLKTPAAEVVLPDVFQPFSEDTPSRVTVSPWRETSLDWRFRVRLPRGTTKVRVVLDGDCLEQLDAGLFVNGAFKGRVIAGDTSLREVHCQVADGALEVSIRPLWAACAVCFPSLETLDVALTDLS